MTLVVSRTLVRSNRAGTGDPSGTCSTKRSCSNTMSQIMTLNLLWKVSPRTDTYTNWKGGGEGKKRREGKRREEGERGTG